jgi:hypothetical protein
VTISNVMQAALYAFTTITSVSALAIALFGSGVALERWLDRPLPKPTRRQVSIPRDPAASPLDPDAQTHAA